MVDFKVLFNLGILYLGTHHIIGMMVTAPLDRVKLLLQTQAVNEKLVGKNYKGIVDAFKRIRKEEGRRAFWRGSVPMILKYFTLDDLLKLDPKENNKGFFDFWPKNGFLSLLMLSYASTSLPNATEAFYLWLASPLLLPPLLVLGYPLDFARTRLAVDIGKEKSERQFTGLRDCFRKIYKTDGIRGVYRGFGASMLGIIVHRSIFIGGRDILKRKDRSPNSESNSQFLTSQLLFILGYLLSYPFDTVSRRLMMQSGRKDVLYTGSVDCFIKIARNEGLKGFYKGSLISLFGLSAAYCLAPGVEVLPYLFLFLWLNCLKFF